MYTLILIFSLMTSDGAAVQRQVIPGFKTENLCITAGNRVVTDVGDKPLQNDFARGPYMNRMRAKYSCIKVE